MQTRYFDLRDTKGQQKEIEDKISAAAKILREGGLVGIPTETVYGLGANAMDGEAVRRIFEAKGRPQDNPLIIHVAGAQWLPRYCADVPPLAYVLARKFWPGPLTMILKRRPIIPDETTAGLDTVGVRCPNHPVTLAIIREAGVPIAAPSARRIDGLDVDRRERVPLSLKTPFAALPPERHADELFGKTRNIVLAEDRHFVLRKFDDIGKGNDLTVDFYGRPRIAEDVRTEVDVETDELSRPAGTAHELFGIEASRPFAQHQGADVDDVRPPEQVVRHGGQMIVRGVLSVKAEGTVAVFVERDKGERRIAAGIAAQIQLFQTLRMSKPFEEGSHKVIADAAHKGALRPEFCCGARHVKGRAARILFIDRLAALYAAGHIA